MEKIGQGVRISANSQERDFGLILVRDGRQAEPGAAVVLLRLSIGGKEWPREGTLVKHRGYRQKLLDTYSENA